MAGGSTWWESSGRSLEGCVQWRCQELSDVGGDAKGQERGPCFRPSAPTGHKLEGWPTPPSICGSPSPPAGVGGHATSFWSGIPVVAVKGNCPPAKASQGPMSEDGHLRLRPWGLHHLGKTGPVLEYSFQRKWKCRPQSCGLGMPGWVHPEDRVTCTPLGGAPAEAACAQQVALRNRTLGVAGTGGPLATIPRPGALGTNRSEGT